MKKSSIILSLLTVLSGVASLQAQTISVDKTQLTFNASVGTTPAPTQTITATSSPSGTVFTAIANSTPASWLKISDSIYPVPQTTITGFTGQTSAVITVTADPTGLSAGNYTGTISLNTTTVVSVTLSVGSIGAAPQNFSFTYQTGGALPAPQAVQLSGSGSYTVTATPLNGGNWLNFTPTGGTLPTSSLVTLSMDPNITPTLAAGTYNAQLTITPIGTPNNAPINIPVTLSVTGLPTATVTPSQNITLNYQIGGANNQAGQTLSIATNSPQATSLSFGVSPSPVAGVNAIQASPANGTFPAGGTQQVTLSYNPAAALQPNTYSGFVTVFTPGQTPPQTSVPLTLLISNSPLLSVSSSALNFLYEVNGAFPATQTLTASSSAVATTAPLAQQMQILVNVTQGATWLAVTPPTGVAPNALFTGMPLTVSANPSGLAPGKYTGNISITGIGAANTAQNVQVTLTVSNDPAIVTNAPTAGVFFQSQIGVNPVLPSQTSQLVTLSSSTGGSLNYNVVAAAANNGTWLSVGPTSGTASGTPATLAITVNPAGLAKGRYTGTVTVTATNPLTGNPALGSPLTIPVTLDVDTNPLLVPTLPGNPPAPPSFTTTVNGSAPAAQTITLSSTNPATTITYSVATSANTPWLSVLPAGGGSTAPGSNTLFVQVNPLGLAAGNYNGSITITSSGVANSPLTIPVSLTVTSGTITLNPTSLSFSVATGGVAPAQAVQVSTNGSQVTFSAVGTPNSGAVNWLSATPATGTTPGSISVSVDASKLTPGTYNGTVTVSAPNAAAANLPVTLTVVPGALSATCPGTGTATVPCSSSTPLTFTQAAGGTAPAAQAIAVAGSPSALSFTVSSAMTSGTGWLTAGVGSTNAATGTTPATVSVAVNAGSLGVGTYQGSVTITSTGASGSPITVPVVLNVVAPQSISFSSSTPLAFNSTLGAPTPLTQTVNLTSSGSAQFTATATATTPAGGTWLAVSPTSGNATSTPTPLTVTVTPTGLAAGSYTGTVTVNSPSSVAPLTLQVNLTVTAVAAPVFNSIKNSASYATGAVAPGELVVIFGTAVGPSSTTFGTVTANQLSTNVAGTQVMFDNIAAPIYYATATQTAVFVPYELAGRPTTSVTVVTAGGTSNALVYNVTNTQPGIYTQNSQGNGPGSILNQDNSVNGPNNGAAAGSVIQIFMTGEGQTSPAGVTGSVIPSNGSGLKTPTGTVTATIGGVQIPATAIPYAGSAPGDVSGVFQVDLIVPTGLGAGPQAITVSVAGVSSQAGVTVQLK